MTQFGFRLLPVLTGVFGVWLALAPSAAQAMASGVPALKPHRAVYELSLDDARSASGITGVDGRMVFEFSGSHCEGYTLNMRMVTQMMDSQGQTNLTDIRSSTWEQAEGKTFRFQSAQYLNDKLDDVTMGRATRKDPGTDVEVRLSRPSPKSMALPPKVLFPTQHSLAIIEAAAAGQSKVEAVLYDGSEKGQKVYDTTAFIGEAVPGGSEEPPEAPAKEQGLGALRSWPVSIGYFDTAGGDLTPAYQIDFRLYENGVSRDLRISYGDFSIRGRLTKLEYLSDDKCE